MNIKSGFTLIEMLIVMAIIALLTALVAPAIINKWEGSQVKAASVQIKMIESALDSYRLDMGKYPKELESLIKNTTNKATWDGPYLKDDIPKDPWNNPYHYQNPGKYRKDYDLISFGADGVEGGEGDNADIINGKIGS